MTIEIKTSEKQVLFDHKKLTVYNIVNRARAGARAGARKCVSKMSQQALSIICRRADLAAGTCPIGMEKLAARFVLALIGMRTKVVALCLQQIGRQ
jgi:hypothetical protein